MTVVTLRGISNELNRALKRRATDNHRSVEDEIKAILELAMLPRSRVQIGSELAILGRNFGGIELDLKRDPDPARSAILD